MSIDKKMNYEIQAGVKNYKPSKILTVPKEAKSSPTHPTAKLAYITDAEKKLLIKKNLHGSLKGKPNRGPGGIPSLQGDFGGPGGFGGFRGGGDYSSAETGNFSGFDGTPSGPELPPGVDPKPSQEALDIRSAAIAAGAGQRVNPGFFDSRDVISPEELTRARAYARDRTNRFAKEAMRRTRGGGIMGFLTSGGIFGNLLRGLGQAFGLGKKFNEPTYDMSRFSGLPLGGSAAFANLDIRDKFDRRGNLIEEDDDEEKITTGYPGENKNFFTTTDDLISTGVQEGPYRGMYDYLEAAPINNQVGLVSTQQFKDSPFAAADFPSFVSDDIDEQTAIDNEIAAMRGYR
jgi:hypothetical protein